MAVVDSQAKWSGAGCQTVFRKPERQVPLFTQLAEHCGRSGAGTPRPEFVRAGQPALCGCHGSVTNLQGDLGAVAPNGHIECWSTLFRTTTRPAKITVFLKYAVICCSVLRFREGRATCDPSRTFLLSLV
jgi:hypothetical protein